MKTVIPFKVLSIGDDGFHLMIKLVLNKKSANVIIDTGASKTVFDKKQILKYGANKKFDQLDSLSSGLGTNTMKSHFTILKKMKIGSLEIEDFKIVLLDLSHVNKSYKEVGLPQIDGVLGSDLLLKYNAVIDYGQKKLKLKFKN